MARKPKAFVLMTFESEFNAVYDLLIHPALTEAGFEVARADTNLNQQNIMRDVIHGIASADIVIADLTDRNPNVYYELGIAHGLSKRTVLLTQSIEALPFDLKPYRVIDYSVMFDKAHELKDRLKIVGDGVLSGETEFGSPVSDFLGIPISEVRPPARSTKTRPAVQRKKKQQRTDEQILERGVVDSLADLERAGGKVVSSMTTITEANQTLTLDLTKRVEAMKRVQQGPEAGRAIRIQLLAKEAAGDLIRYSDRILRTLPQWARYWKMFTDSAIEFLTSDAVKQSPDRENVLELREPTRTALEAIRSSTAQIKEMQGSLKSMEGVSFDLTRAARQASQAVAKMVDDLELAEAAFARILALIDESAHPQITTTDS